MLLLLLLLFPRLVTGTVVNTDVITITVSSIIVVIIDLY